MNDRLVWLRNSLKTQGIQGMIISNPINIKYLTNISAEGILLMTLKENVYITDDRYIEDVKRILTVDDEIVVTNARNVSIEDYENFFMLCDKVGFEENYVTYAKYKEIMQKYKMNELVETEGIIEKQRLIKDEEEINNIRKACEITDACFEHLLNYIRKEMTEKQIANEVEKFFKANGASGLSFDTIIASGENSSIPHAVPTDRKIMSEDAITIDMGCKYNGYCSDMTRTIFVDRVNDYIKEVYDLVRKNQALALSEMHDNANIKNITKMVESNFALYDQELIHALGHGVGLEVHEDPIISSRNERILKSGMVITNEPGIYLPGKFGVRIEDTVLITDTGCETLTKSSKDYCII